MWNTSGKRVFITNTTNLRTLRLNKMDKEAVFLLSFPKTGSTLLAYICALINTRGGIKKFRNDFDLVPMISFPQSRIYQNFNARQDGKFQLYKLNGCFMDMYAPMKDIGAKKLIWSGREFHSYFCSRYWWIREFNSRINPFYFFTKYMSFGLFKTLCLKPIAQRYIDEMFYVYNFINQKNSEFEVLFVTYEQITKEKENLLITLCNWMGIEPDRKLIQFVSDATSKAAMAEGDRFDPISYGEGSGLSKINLSSHKHQLNQKDFEIYDAMFRKKFANTGINSYEELCALMRQTQPNSGESQNMMRSLSS